MSTFRNNCPERRFDCNVRGFTLFEVVLATALAATLLLGLWSLFSIYARLFEAGQAKTESSQLARALLDQLAVDLRSAIQDPIPAASSKPRTSTPLRRFTLSGSAHELRLDVLQLTPLEGNPTPVSDSEQLVEESSPARVPELRTVYYTFQEPSLANDLAADPADEILPGLTRRELDFETPVTEQPLMESAGPLPGSLGLADDPAADGAFTPNVVDDSVVWAPEVVRLDFRYYDGGGWSGQWNSLARKSLPVAVEVTLQLRTVGRPTPPAPVENAESDELADPTDTLDGQPAPAPEGPIYRLLVDLPSSPKYAAPQQVRPVAKRRAPKPVTRPAPSPPRRRPAAPAVRPLSDEWMRTQP